MDGSRFLRCSFDNVQIAQLWQGFATSCAPGSQGGQEGVPCQGGCRGGWRLEGLSPPYLPYMCMEMLLRFLACMVWLHANVQKFAACMQARILSASLHSETAHNSAFVVMLCMLPEPSLMSSPFPRLELLHKCKLALCICTGTSIALSCMKYHAMMRFKIAYVSVLTACSQEQATAACVQVPSDQPGDWSYAWPWDPCCPLRAHVQEGVNVGRPHLRTWHNVRRKMRCMTTQGF